MICVHKGYGWKQQKMFACFFSRVTVFSGLLPLSTRSALSCVCNIAKYLRNRLHGGLSLDRRRAQAGEFSSQDTPSRSCSVLPCLCVRTGTSKTPSLSLPYCPLAVVIRSSLSQKSVKAAIYLTLRRDKRAYAQCYRDMAQANPSAATYILLGEAYMRIQMPEVTAPSYPWSSRCLWSVLRGQRGSL